MATEKELIAALGPRWYVNAARSAKQVVACQKCKSAEGHACSPFITPPGKVNCPERVLAAAQWLYDQHVGRNGAVSGPQAASGASPYQVPPVPVDRVEAMREAWLSGDLRFEPTDDPKVALLMLATAHHLGRSGVARVVVEDLDGNCCGVLWGPPDDHEHDHATQVPKPTTTTPDPPVLSPERLAEIETAARLADEYERERAERLARERDPGPDDLMARLAARARGERKTTAN